MLIPVKTDYLAYRGLTQLQDSIQEIQELINPDLAVAKKGIYDGCRPCMMEEYRSNHLGELEEYKRLRK